MRTALAVGLIAAASPIAAGTARLTPEARLAKMIDGRVPGKPVSCISLHSIQSSEIIDRTAIVYRSGGKLYVNTPRAGASQLDRDDILVTQPFGSQLCRVDTVRLLDRSSRFPTGFVSLGDFVPYTKQ